MQNSQMTPLQLELEKLRLEKELLELQLQKARVPQNPTGPRRMNVKYSPKFNGYCIPNPCSGERLGRWIKTYGWPAKNPETSN